MRSRGVLVALSACTGILWGIVAALFGNRAFGEAVWAGVLASPLIGAAVGLVMQGWFESSAPLGRKGIALLSLYLGALLFGIALGLWDWWPGGAGQALTSALGEGIGSALFGLTISGFVIAFWPLAYLTHVVIARARGIGLLPAS